MMVDYPQKKCCLLITALSAVLTLWGLLAIYRLTALTGDAADLLLRQSLWAVTAWCIFWKLSQLQFTVIVRACYLLVPVGALAMLLLPLFGLSINGMHGWYALGALTIQPSELLKPFYIVFLIQLLQNQHRPEWQQITLAGSVILLFILLLLLQPDLGTMLVYAAGGAGALYFNRVRLRWLLLSLGGSAALGVIAIARHGYMLDRVLNFWQPQLDPAGGSWHLRQFAIAVARGEFTGVKSQMAVWSNSFLPLAHNDSIFAACSEMLGFCGSLVLLLLLGGLFYNCFRLAQLQTDPMRRAVIDALSCMLLLQTLLHILVNLGLLPPTGVTLPLISYGGSSLTGTMILLAIIITAGEQHNSDCPPAEKIKR